MERKERRKRVLSNTDVERYKMPRNAIFRAYQKEFNMMFKEFLGKPKTPYQKPWYVFERWDSLTEQRVPASDSPENRLLKFVREKAEGGERDLRLTYGWTGCGKTTFLNHFFYEFLPTRYPEICQNVVPIIVDCARSGIEVGDLEEDIDHNIHQKLSKEFFWLDNREHYFNIWFDEVNWDSDFYHDLWKDLGPVRTEKKKRAWIEKQREGLRYGRKTRTPWGDFNRVRLNYLVKNFEKKIIVVWDNIDHASADVQIKAIQLAMHKLSWIPGIKIIVSVREYTVPKVQSEIPPGAYRFSDQHICPPFVHKLLKERARSVLDVFSQQHDDKRTLDVGGISVTIRHGKQFLNTVLASFSENRQNEKMLCELSNDNVRKQLDMVHAVLKSGHIDRKEILESLRAYYERWKKPWTIPWHNVAESLICGAYQYKPTGASLVENLFDCGEKKHHFNTLAFHHILEIISDVDAGVYVNSLCKQLGALGYPRSCIESCLNILLKDGLITSESGISVLNKKDMIVRITRAGTYYLDDFMYRLIYLQHMALVTHMEEKYRRDIRAWRQEDFKTRITGCRNLIYQIRDDEKRELDLVHLKGKRAKAIYNEYGFGHLHNTLAECIIKELERIRREENHTIKLSDSSWNGIIGWFKQLLPKVSPEPQRVVELKQDIVTNVDLLTEKSERKESFEETLKKLDNDFEERKIGEEFYYMKRLSLTSAIKKLCKDIDRLKEDK